MSELHNVGISDMKSGQSPDRIVTYALGSCVGICLYDDKLKTGALGHIMLPKMPAEANKIQNKHKFADTCIPEMVKELERLGCSKVRLTAKIAGGAKMFEVYGDDAFASLGERNVKAVKEALIKQRIRIVAEDVLENYGRTVFFDLATGKAEIKSYSKPLKVL